MTYLWSLLISFLIGLLPHLTKAQNLVQPAFICNEASLPNTEDAACLSSCGPSASSATCLPDVGVCVCQYPSCSASNVGTLNPSLCPASEAGPWGPVLPEIVTLCATECPGVICPGGAGVICNTDDATVGVESWICNCACPPNPCPTPTSSPTQTPDSSNLLFPAVGLKAKGAKLLTIAKAVLLLVLKFVAGLIIAVFPVLLFG